MDDNLWILMITLLHVASLGFSPLHQALELLQAQSPVIARVKLGEHGVYLEIEVQVLIWDINLSRVGLSDAGGGRGWEVNSSAKSS